METSEIITKKQGNCKKVKDHDILILIENIRDILITLLPKGVLLYGKKLTDKKLSIYLGQDKNYITYLKKNIKRNLNYLITSQVLDKFKKRLKSILGEKVDLAIALIDRYEELNKLKENYEKIYYYHPNINLRYFETIDDKEKAYWLGFIYADGNLSYRTEKRRSIRFSFYLSIKDKDSKDTVYNLAKILGIEVQNVRTDSRNVLIGFQITNNTLAKYLNKHGVLIGKKSKKIELPHLNNRELYLAFLLGYYDGDGSEGSTVLSSGSKKFLEQIKDKFNITYDIRLKKCNSIINGRRVKGKGYDLALGAELFNEMMHNYSESMKRKRKIFETPEEKSERMRQVCKYIAKVKITEEFLKNLEQLTWKKPLYKIAEDLGISVSRVSSICSEYNVNKPPIGYWKKAGTHY
ncbi:MAG: hypothetical protein EU529_03025 [Promethearchaeota archaeon]|nr:MAG: hypothetical protein EU529_03025 [Candidatus Lokiarchaeota archaeon]